MASVISAGTTSTTALNLSGDTTGVLQLQTNGTTAAITIDTDQRAAFVAGTAALPSITTTGDTNTGIYFPAADTIAFTEGGAEAMRISSDGSIGIATTTPSASFKLDVVGSGRFAGVVDSIYTGTTAGSTLGSFRTYGTGSGVTGETIIRGILNTGSTTSSYLEFQTTNSGTTAERMRIDSSGNVGIGITSPGSLGLSVAKSSGTATGLQLYQTTTEVFRLTTNNTTVDVRGRTALPLVFFTDDTERMRITSGGTVLVGATSDAAGVNGTQISGAANDAYIAITTTISSGGSPFYINRHSSDGTLIDFRQANTSEGTISVSGTTVSYNGGHLARWSQLPDNSKDDTILKGTVMSNLDDMCVWEKDGVIADNEQLNKMKVSDVEGDTNVAGVFVNWTRDEDFNSDDMNVAMTGDMIIRIAQGVVVQKGDLLMSAGDGTAKPQGDDIVRSKTIAKVTSNHVTCTYADGSYCVPCVLMAC